MPQELLTSFHGNPPGEVPKVAESDLLKYSIMLEYALAIDADIIPKINIRHLGPRREPKYLLLVLLM